MAGGAILLRVSWSGLKAHEECKQKGMLARSGHTNPSRDIRNFFPGTVVDRVMRRWLEGGHRAGEMPGLVDEILDAEEKTALEGDGVVRWRNSGDRDAVREWCRELCRRFEPILYKYVVPFEFQVGRRFAVPVQIELENGSPQWITLSGETDLVVRDSQQRYAVYDLKGTNDPTYWRKTMAQLVFYELAWESEFEVLPVMSALFQPMCPDPVLSFRFEKEDHDQMWSRIVRYATDVWNRDFAPKPTSGGCTWCDVKHACAKFKPSNGGLSLTGAPEEGLLGLFTQRK